MSRIADFFTEAPRSRQIWLVAGTAAVLFGVLAAAYFALRPSYQVLFSDLKAGDANAIVAELEKQKVPYRLDETPSGNVILVPEGDMRGMRLKLMKGDLRLSGVVGLELFNNSDLGLTEFAQKVNYQRALQGELARTIMTLDEIDQARVHLTLPESSIFRRDGIRPKASVALFLHEGKILEAGTIRGIQRLVAAAVPELAVGDVTILDQHGALAADKSGNTIDDPKFALKQALERSYEQKILAQIASIAGDVAASVSVDATLNFDQAKTTRETGRTEPIYDTNGKESLNITLPRSKSGLLAGLPKPALAGDGKAAALPPLPALVAPAALEGSKSYHETEQIVSAPGTVKRLSVGIVLKQALSPQELSRLNAVVSASIGLNTARGDVLNTFVKDVGTVPAMATHSGSADGIAEPVFNNSQEMSKAQVQLVPEPVVQRFTVNGLLTALGRELTLVAPDNPLAYLGKHLGLRGRSVDTFSGFMLVAILSLLVLGAILYCLLRRRARPPATRQLTAAQRQEYVDRLRLLIAAPGAQDVGI